jgi:ubiquinone biosynthesis protein
MCPSRSSGSPTALARLREIAGVLSRHGFGPTMEGIPLLRSFASDDDVARRHRPAAVRFASVLEDLGPTFVKLGQILSTRADLLPPDFVEALSRLQDAVPPFGLDDVKAQLASAWGGALTDHVAWFDETPLASASMAQVHAARLKDGSDVVVKIQRPGIADQVKNDAEMLVLLAQLLERVVKEASTYRAVDLVSEFKDALAQEVDFRIEAKNLLLFAQKNEGRRGVHVPRLYPALSGRTVLVMERIHGKRITELAGDDPDKRARAQRVIARLVEVAFEHVFVDGVFHGDPHPGNLLVDDDDNLCFIDFGLVGYVQREAQDRMLMVLLALSLRDSDTLARLVLRLGDIEGRVEIAPLRTAIAKLLERYFGSVVGELSTAAILTDLIDVSTRFGVRLPRELAILSKASVSIDGIVRLLHPNFDPPATVAKRAEELLRNRLDPRALEGGGLRSALQLAMFIQELPIQLGQVLTDLERGQLQVVVKSEHLANLNTTLRGVGMSVFGGILAGALIVVGFGALYESGRLTTLALPIALTAFTVAGGCFGVAFAWYITGGRLPKIRLARLIGSSLGRLKNKDGSAP